jgi:hypothetical protein
MEDRRKHPRHRVWFPLTLRTEDGAEEAFAISYDLSSSGLLMACPGRLAPGTRVRIQLHAEGDGPPLEAEGEVLRVRDNDPEGAAGPWRYRMAVRFTEPVPWLEAALQNAAEQATEEG